MSLQQQRLNEPEAREAAVNKRSKARLARRMRDEKTTAGERILALEKGLNEKDLIFERRVFESNFDVEPMPAEGALELALDAKVKQLELYGVIYAETLHAYVYKLTDVLKDMLEYATDLEKSASKAPPTSTVHSESACHDRVRARA